MKKIFFFLFITLFCFNSFVLSNKESDDSESDGDSYLVSREPKRLRTTAEEPRDVSSSDLPSLDDSSDSEDLSSNSASGSDTDDDAEGNQVAPALEQRQPARRNRHVGKNYVQHVKVYHLINAEDLDYSDLLNQKNSRGKPKIYTAPYSCRVNPNACWYGQRQTQTRPKTWGVISDGTGIDFDESNEANVGEHWVCFIEQSGQLFAVTFGQTKLLQDEFVDKDFGKRVVRNIAAESREHNSGVLSAILPDTREHEILGKKVNGKDYCQLKRKTKLRDLPLLCSQLWEISESGIGDAYHESRDHLKPVEDMSGRGIQPLREGESVTVGDRIYVKYFERLYEANPDFVRDLNQFTLNLLGERDPVPELQALRSKESEGDYNERMAGNHAADLILLDKKNVRKIEVCDLLNAVQAVLIHIKIDTDGALLNHLFGQGHTSADLLRRNGEFLDEIPLAIIRLTIEKTIRDCLNTLLEPVVQQLNDSLKRLVELFKKIKGVAKVNGFKKIEKVSNIPTEGALTKFKQPTISESFNNQSPDVIEYRGIFGNLQKEFTKFRYKPLKAQIDNIFKRKEKEGVSGLIDRAQAALRRSKTAARTIELPKEQLLEHFERLKTFVENYAQQKRATVVYGVCIPQKRLDPATGDKRAELIPLGPRINLRRFALALESMGFTVRLQYIPWLANNDEIQDSAVPPNLPLNARTPNQQAAIDRAREQEDRLVPEGHRIENMLCYRMEEEDEEVIMLDESKFIHPLTAGELIQPFRQLGVFYPQGTGHNGITLFQTYVLGPTIANGNCFFHAALTEEGQNKDIMEARIAQIRASLPEVVMRSPDYISRIKGEILAEYKASRHHAPELLRKMLKQNDRQEALRNKTIDFLKEKHILENPGVGYNDYDPSQEDIPDFLRRTPYSDDALLSEISEQDVRNYMQRYSRNRGTESYITIPAGHGETSAIGSIISEQQDVLVHCFMLNRRQGMLTYKGAVGQLNAQKVVSILYHSEHYWALYNAGESEDRRRGILQAAINESTH